MEVWVTGLLTAEHSSTHSERIGTGLRVTNSPAPRNVTGLLSGDLGLDIGVPIKVS